MPAGGNEFWIYIYFELYFVGSCFVDKFFKIFKRNEMKWREEKKHKSFITICVYVFHETITNAINSIFWNDARPASASASATSFHFVSSSKL